MSEENVSDRGQSGQALSDRVLPGTAERVPAQTHEEVNERLRREMGDRLEYFAAHPDEIGGRLRELEREWDIERTLEANASALTLVFLGLGATVNRRFLVMPAVIATFLLQHALQGWCPPVPFFRQLGVRTQREIDVERAALKALQETT